MDPTSLEVNVRDTCGGKGANGGFNRRRYKVSKTKEEGLFVD